MISVYVTFSGQDHVPASATLKPLRLGPAPASVAQDAAAGTAAMVATVLRDVVGAQRWACTNDATSAYVGFFRADTYLDFNRLAERRTDPRTGRVIAESFGIEFTYEFALSDEQIAAILDGADAVVAQPLDTAASGDGSVRRLLAPHPCAPVLEIAAEAIRARRPSDIAWFDAALEHSLFYRGHSFIFSRPVFERYCDWLFEILDFVEARLDGAADGNAAPDALALCAEVLFSAFVLRLLSEPGPGVVTLREVRVLDTGAPPRMPALPETDRPVVSLAAASDAAYLPHLGALIASVLSNADPERFIDFVVLDGGLDAASRKRLRDLEMLHPFCAISFIDMSRAFLDFGTHSYFARSTFYRLALPVILGNRSRVLFLDTDMIVLDDLAEIFDTDLAGKPVAATPDLVMRSFAALGIRAIEEAGGQPARTYLADRLGMSEAPDAYFQAGVVVFDLAALRESGLCRTVIDDLRKNTYWFLDQDALNKYLSMQCMPLDARWNAIYLAPHHYEALAAPDREAYSRAFADPGIVHFAGRQKPWETSLHPFSPFYWYYLRRTAWYELVLFQRLEQFGLNRMDEPSPPEPRAEEPPVVEQAIAETEPEHPEVAEAEAPSSLLGRTAQRSWALLPSLLKRPLLPLARRARTRLR